MAALLAERGIEVVTGAVPIRFDEDESCLSVSPRAAIEADAVLSLPRMEGRRVGGVPYDLAGFIPVDDHGRVRGMERTYAAGDATTFPVKQGGIATQQADVAAEAIATELGCEVEAEPLDPVLRGVLWTGAKPLYLSGYLAGGHGETSIASDEPPWDGAEQGQDRRQVSDPVPRPSQPLGRLIGAETPRRHSGLRRTELVRETLTFTSGECYGPRKLSSTRGSAGAHCERPGHI